MSLANTDMQRRVWLGRGTPAWGLCASFGDVVHRIYDDTAVGEDVDGAIGRELYDQEEADSLRHITSRIDFMFDAFGGTRPDKFYLDRPEWPEIVEAAKSCLSLFQENERRYGWSAEN